MRYALALLALLFAFPAVASEALPSTGGEVRVPLSDYTGMLNQLSPDPRRAPASYAIGQSTVGVVVSDRDGQKTAAVSISVRVEVFEDEWTLVPLLPSGAALRRASVDGQAVQLVEDVDGLSWSTDKAGVYALELVYDVDAQHYQSGEVLPLAVPRAAATTFSLSFPEAGVDLSVVPSADLKASVVDDHTLVTASVPATSTSGWCFPACCWFSRRCRCGAGPACGPLRWPESSCWSSPRPRHEPDRRVGDQRGSSARLGW